MAHFYASIQGNRGEATRCGSKTSGLTSTVSGWDIGVEVTLEYDANLGTDIVHIYATEGSNGCSRKRILSYIQKEGRRVILDTEHPEVLL
jgi:hypothetical protein